jgi:hypothetical protein
VKEQLLFAELGPSELDPFLAEIDRAVDALFLADVDDTVEQLRADRVASDDAAA